MSNWLISTLLLIVITIGLCEFMDKVIGKSMEEYAKTINTETETLRGL